LEKSKLESETEQTSQDAKAHNLLIAAPSSVAMLEAGVMDEAGEWIPGKDWRRGLAAYREKVAST
jgi:hypothetical protein